MALTCTIIKRAHVGPLKHNIVDVTLDSSYVTGGEAVTLANLGLAQSAKFVSPGSNGSYTTVFDYTNTKLLVYRTGAINAVAEQVPNATDLSAVTVRLIVEGV